MRYFIFLALLLPLSIVSAQCPTLLWADEFDGNTLNESDWNYQVGDGCDLGICDWGNNELQWYARENVVVEDGKLKIFARQENVGGKSYTSGRITTKDKQDFKYGYYEARMKLPPGGGLWPAFWMLPTDEVYGIWPQSGEIDIMEWVGNQPQTLFGTLHFGQLVPNNSSTGDQLVLKDKAWSDDYHVFAVDWQEDIISWYVDGYRYGTKRSGNLSPERWPFDRDFHFLLNLAIGGTFGGALSSGAVPATMEVDYLRVFDRAPASIRGPRELDREASGAAFVVDGLPEGATINWSLPDGAVITDDSSPNGIVVDFGQVGGLVSATIVNGCREETLSIDVYLPPALEAEYSFENFDQEAQAIYDFSTGTLTEVSNPAPNTVNGSDLTGKYVRDAAAQFDVIVYNVNTINDASDYTSGNRALSMDVYTDAPVGREILLQLETASAMGDNYPTGRHSRYTARTTKQGEWERMTFTLLDEPDGNASDRGVRKLVMLMSPNTTTGDTYYYDNLDSYAEPVNSLFSVETLEFPVSVQPNPVSDQARISYVLPQPATVNVRLLDAAGRLVLQLPAIGAVAGDNQLDMDLSELARGMYFVQLRLGQGVKTVRLVKQ